VKTFAYKSFPNDFILLNVLLLRRCFSYDFARRRRVRQPLDLAKFSSILDTQFKSIYRSDVFV